MKTREEFYQALDALRRAQGQIEAALRVRDPAPEVLATFWRRAAGEVRVFAPPAPRRDRVSEEGRYGHE